MTNSAEILTISKNTETFQNIASILNPLGLQNALHLYEDETETL